MYSQYYRYRSNYIKGLSHKYLRILRIEQIPMFITRHLKMHFPGSTFIFNKKNPAKLTGRSISQSWTGDKPLPDPVIINIMDIKEDTMLIDKYYEQFLFLLFVLQYLTEQNWYPLLLILHLTTRYSFQ